MGEWVKDSLNFPLLFFFFFPPGKSKFALWRGKDERRMKRSFCITWGDIFHIRNKHLYIFTYKKYKCESMM